MATSLRFPEDVVHSDPERLGGTAVFVGARVPVQSLFDDLKAGDGTAGTPGVEQRCFGTAKTPCSSGLCNDDMCATRCEADIALLAATSPSLVDSAALG